MINEQGDTRSGNRHESFMSCGLLIRMQKVATLHNTVKLKLLLTGAVLLHGKDTPTLTLEDFATGDKISARPAVCQNNNIGLILALKNFQMTMQIVFSDFFETPLDAFIDNLEGVNRPMELVTADFLKYSVELTLREFFRVVRSVKSSAISVASVKTPEECATFLRVLFDKLTEDLSDHSSRMVEESFFRVRMARTSSGMPAAEKTGTERTQHEKLSVKFEAATAAEGKKGSRPCAGHIGSQLNAVKPDGRPYTCGYGKECTFRHITIEGKTVKKLTELAEGMPPAAQRDILKAIKNRK